MSFILALAISSLLTGPASMDQGQVTVGSSSSTFSWQCPELEEYSHLPRGLTGFTAPGCGCQGDVLLPRRTLVLAIPPGSEPRLRVTPHGVERLGPLIPASVAVSDEGIDIYSATDITSDNWGRIVETGVFRRAGYAVLELDPVITSDGGLLRAQRLDVTLE